MNDQEYDAIYADGGVILRNPSEIGGTWVFVLVKNGEKVRHHSGVLTPEVVRLPAVTNNVTELYAVIRALRCVPNGWEGTVYTDSFVTVCRVFFDGKLAGVPDWLAEAVGIERVRLKRGYVKARHVLLDGHPTKAQLAAGKGKRGNPCSEWNVFCDSECGRRAKIFLATRMSAACLGALG